MPAGRRAPLGSAKLRLQRPVHRALSGPADLRLTMRFLAGRRAFIVGVATERSIAWGIAQAMRREGAELAFSYVNDKMKERVVPLAQSVNSPLVMPLDVTVDEQTDAAF